MSVWVLRALAVAMVLTLVACGTDSDPEATTAAGEAPAGDPAGDGSPAGPAGPSGTLVMAGDGIGDSFVPAATFQGWAHSWVLNNVFETLYTFRDFEDLIPQLATDHEISEDGLTHTFTLREGVEFHDGTPFDAEAVEFNYMRYLDEGHEFYDPNAVLAGTVLPGVVEVRATGEYEVEFALSEPSVALPAQLASSFGGIMSPEAVREAGAADAGLAPVGTGQYRFGTVEAGDRVTLEAFADHWDGPPPLERVVIRAIPDETALTAALLSGEVDLTPFVDFKDLEQFEDHPDLDVTVVPAVNTGYMPFNAGGSEGVETFADVRVRQAALHAIDRQRIIDTIFHGYADPAGGFIPKPSWAHVPDLTGTYDYDPDRARELLAEAGAEGTEVTLLVQTSGFWPRMGELVQSDLSDAGFDVSLERVDSAAFFGVVSEGRQDVWLADATPNNPDPPSTFEFFLGCDNPRNLRVGGWCDEHFDSLLLDQRQEQDADRRLELIREMEEILLDEAVMGNLYYGQFAYVTSSRVRDFEPAPMRHLFLDNTSVTE